MAMPPPNPPSVTTIRYSIVLLAIFIPLIFASSIHEGCNSLQILTSRVSECEKLSSGRESCSVSGQAQLTLSNLGSTTCIFFSDDSGSNIYYMRIMFKDIKCTWSTIHQYYTFPVRYIFLQNSFAQITNTVAGVRNAFPGENIFRKLLKNLFLGLVSLHVFQYQPNLVSVALSTMILAFISAGTYSPSTMPLIESTKLLATPVDQSLPFRKPSKTDWSILPHLTTSPQILALN